MPLVSGSRLGVYEVTAPIGRGGMGVVYRARDTRLGRDVALKVLPEALNSDPDRIARFEREARVLAALNHPHIATIYGFEEGARLGPGEAGPDVPPWVLVMELVEGPPLADTLAARRLTLDEALRIARQIADALEAAHEKGLIHRDLKPANVIVTPDGSAKVLDFGLAKLAAGNAAADPGGAPTITADGTGAGAVVGTARYMSPEQARGQPLDRRTDIWSFGCVLYEMLTGRAAFPAEALSTTFAAILTGEPDWGALPEATPIEIRTLLRRCLEKDPRQRLRDIGDARIEIDGAIALHSSPARDEPGAAVAGGRAVARRNGRSHLTLASVAAAVALVALAASIWLISRDRTPPQTIRTTVLLPPGVSVTRGPGRTQSLAVSPDGRTLIIAGTDATGQRLYARRLDQLEATPIPGTEGGLSPFFSPDGAWIGFFADRRLKRVPAGGGAAVDITAAPGFPAGASWGPDGRIVFASGANSPLRAVSADGGTAEPLTPPKAGPGHVYPEILPDGRTLLFHSAGSIHALDLNDGRRIALLPGTTPRYAATGHLILSRGTTLLAAPFDPARLEVTGTVAPILEGVAIEASNTGAPAHAALSRSSGTLAYVPTTRLYELVVLEADGTERVLSEGLMLQNPQFSPDGRRLVVAATRRAGEESGLWVHDLEGVTPPWRLTRDGGRAPVWTPDGASITYSRTSPAGQSGIYSTTADGLGDPRQILGMGQFHWLVGWTPTGTLAYGIMEQVGADGISSSSIVALEGGEPRRVIGPGDTWGGRLSPDGRWLAYYSLDSGYFEVYVTPFPDKGPRWLIAEGTDPAWSPDGSEIYYRTGSRLMAARIDRAAGIRVRSERLVVEPFSPPLFDDYDIHPDGRTLALVRPSGGAQGREITVILNWRPELQPLPPE